MPLTRVTISGADESVSPLDLIELSRTFRFVEWGVLVSRDQKRPRYPGLEWVRRLQRCATNEHSSLALSLHLCGQFVRDLLAGRPIFTELGLTLDGFQRVQLNLGRVQIPRGPRWLEFVEALLPVAPRQLIFQLAMPGAFGFPYLDYVDAARITGCVPCFDASGGHGVQPARWPTPDMLAEHYEAYGYAGGLGPHNLADELPKILDAADQARQGPVPIWIDMESHVRSNHDHQFDLAKVWECLKIAAPFITL